MSGALLELGDLAGAAEITDAADVVIIGSGPAGATAARVLTEAGVDVVIIEEGPRYDRSRRRADAWSAFQRSWRDLSFQVARGKAFTPIIQGKAVGGSTPINGAIIHRMPEPIHETWVADHGVGELLSYEALVRVFDVMDRELSVAPTSDDVLGGNNRLFRDGCDALGISSQPTARAVDGCKASARCNQGCPTDRKQSMDVTYIPRSIAAGARVYATCRAEEIETSGGRATGVRGTFRDPITGAASARLRVEARKAVVLAAGAVHSPLILARHGFGRRSGLLGRRFQCHPGTSIMPLFDEPVRFWWGATQGYETKEWWHERMKFEVVGLPPSVAVARMPGFGPKLMQRLANMDHVAHWGIQVRAEAHGRVKRGFGGRPSIHYGMTARDVRVAKLALERLVQIAFAAGAREVLLGIPGLPDSIDDVDGFAPIHDLPDDPRLFHCICAHLFGTTTIGRDASSSVVREDGRLWDVAGLYVMDASVFPTNMGVNPQHTIAGIAWLMAERLADAAA